MIIYVFVAVAVADLYLIFICSFAPGAFLKI